MMTFKYLVAAVNFLFFLLMVLVASIGVKEKDSADVWLCLVIGLLPAVNMIAILG